MRDMHWDHIPRELRERPQWVVCTEDKIPFTPVANTPAKVNDPSTWTSFAVARKYAEEYGMQLGYVITADDPYVCIDLDVIDGESQLRKGQPIDSRRWTDKAQMEWFYQAIRHVDSYTEWSISGKGFHIWVRGKLDYGIRQGGLEVYPHGRFIVCTGNYLYGYDTIHERQAVLTGIAEAYPERTQVQALPDEDETKTDEQVYRLLAGQENGAKFIELWEGRWQCYGYPSQSEADEALIGMLCFRSKNNEQVRRMFRLSTLGQRKKAQRDDYLNRTINRIRFNESVKLAAVMRNANAFLDANNLPRTNQ